MRIFLPDKYFKTVLWVSKSYTTVCFNSWTWRFLNIDISQGSVATCLSCGGIFKDAVLQICYWVQQWKNFENWLTFGEVTDKSVLFFSLTVYIAGSRYSTQPYGDFSFHWEGRSSVCPLCSRYATLKYQIWCNWVRPRGHMSLYRTVSKFPTLQNLLLSSTYVICYCIRINWNSASTNREKSAKKCFPQISDKRPLTDRNVVITVH